MKLRRMALIGVALLVAVAPHAFFGVLYFGGDSLPRLGRHGDVRVVNGGGGFIQLAPADAFAPAPQENASSPEELRGLRGAVVPVREYTIIGPHSHDNLSIYLIHGTDTLKGQRVMPLQTALAQNKALVREGAITIDNFAAVPVFIQAGDIIKGGNQDRTLPYDHLVAPGVQQLPLNAFCVEQGRSFPRGNEISHSFQTSTEQLPGKKLHLAARYRQNQNDVWNGVRDVQVALARNVGGSVQAPLSQTSLQLTLEHDRVQRALASYFDGLAAQAMQEKDVIGVAVAINGEIQSADVYASSSLFQELWPKLLKANGVAALAEKKGAAAAPPSADTVKQFLLRAEKATECRQATIGGTLVLRQEGSQALMYDTCDRGQQNLVVHRSFLAK